MGFFRSIGRAFKKVGNAIADGVKKVADTVKKVATKVVDVAKQAANVVKSAVKLVAVPFQMAAAIASGKGLDGARDVMVTAYSEFGQELNKLVDSAVDLAVTALDATPMGAILNKIPGFETVKAIVVDVVSSTFKSVGNTITSAAAVVGAIGEESFKNVMKKVGDLALNVLDAASNFVPAGKVASVIGKVATAVDAGMTVKTLSTEDGRAAFKAGVQAIKNNPETAATLAVGFAAGGAGGGMGAKRSAGVGTSPMGGSKPAGAPGASNQKPGVGQGPEVKSTETSKVKKDGDGEVGDSVEEVSGSGAEIVAAATSSGQAGGVTGKSVGEEYPQYANFNVSQPFDLASLLLLSGVGVDRSGSSGNEDRKKNDPALRVATTVAA